MGVDILLVAPHAFIRAALRSLLERQEGLHVVHEVEGARQLLLHLPAYECDLMLLDYELPNASSAAVIAEVKRQRPTLPLIALSMRSDVIAVAQAFAAGVDGYILKYQEASIAIEAIERVARGEQYLAPGIARSAVDRASSALRDGALEHGPLAGLSRREREIFDLLARGYSGRNIASNLFISPRTVDTHRTHIFHKLGVHSEVELLRFAVRHQLVQPERLDSLDTVEPPEVTLTAPPPPPMPVTAMPAGARR